MDCRCEIAGATRRACVRIGLRLRARLNGHGIVDRSTASQRGVVAGAGFELARLVRHIGTYAWTRSNRTGLSLERLHTAYILPTGQCKQQNRPPGVGLTL